MDSKNILIADDHSLILEGFSKLLQKMPETGDIDLFSNGAAVCDKLREKQYDIYIIDLRLPDMDGFELINKIREAHDDAKIIVCTMNEDVWVINRLMQTNVDGIVSKNSPSNHVEDAVRLVLTGATYCCPRFSHLKRRYETHCRKMGSRTMNITLREQEVLGYIIEGMTTREIAEMMGISDNGVEGFRKNLMEKTGSRNVAQLVSFAYENKLIASGGGESLIMKR